MDVIVLENIIKQFSELNKVIFPITSEIDSEEKDIIDVNYEEVKIPNGSHSEDV